MSSFATAAGDFQTPRYPIVALVTSESDAPDQAAFAWLQRELKELSSDLPTGIVDMDRYRVVWAGAVTRFWCGYQTCRYRYKRIMREVGYRVWLRDANGEPRWQQANGRRLPLMSEDLSHDETKWPTWASPYRTGHKWGIATRMPSRYYFDVGRQHYVIEEYITPQTACEGWDAYRWAWNQFGERVDVLGPAPTRGAYVPVLEIQDLEVEGLYATPSQLHLDIIRQAHKIRMVQSKTKPGDPLSGDDILDYVERYDAAMYIEEMKQVERDGERTDALLDARAEALAAGRTRLPTAEDLFGKEG